MAVNQAWFQNWQPPVPLVTDSRLHQSKIFNDHINFRQIAGNPSSILSMLPYITSLGMVSSTVDYIPTPKPSQSSLTPNILERTGPFKTHYYWKTVDFAFPSPYIRESAILTGHYVQKNNLPLGIEVHKNRIFVSFPKWKNGIPCTLAVLPKLSGEASPLFKPYPNWEWHATGSCDNLVSVYRMQIDECNRLWVIDSGQINVSVKPEQICAPKIVVFDLNTDEELFHYKFPREFIKQDSLYSNIAVDVNQRSGCNNAYAYVADVWRFGVVVYSLKENQSWRLTDHLFYPDPFAAAYNLHGLNFDWTDGIFSLALSPEIGTSSDRYLYYHPMSSFREFYVRTAVLKNETLFNANKKTIKPLGESRGKDGQASSAVMDKNGIMFFNLVSKDAVACWDSRKPYKRGTIGILAQSNVSLVFPNDLRLDKERRQSVWVISNRLPFFLYSSLNENDYNFRIMSAFVDEAVSGTVCDPSVDSHDNFDDFGDDDDYYA